MHIYVSRKRSLLACMRRSLFLDRLYVLLSQCSLHFPSARHHVSSLALRQVVPADFSYRSLLPMMYRRRELGALRARSFAVGNTGKFPFLLAELNRVDFCGVLKEVGWDMIGFPLSNCWCRSHKLSETRKNPFPGFRGGIFNEVKDLTNAWLRSRYHSYPSRFFLGPVLPCLPLHGTSQYLLSFVFPSPHYLASASVRIPHCYHLSCDPGYHSTLILSHYHFSSPLLSPWLDCQRNSGCSNF
jgi:hypothetical protein